MLEEFEQRGYHNGGFKIYDVSNPAQPKASSAITRPAASACTASTWTTRYAYISTEMEGYVGNILVIYDLRDPKKPEEVSRWWMPGPAHRRRRDADLVRPPASPASRAALRRRDVGELLARRLLGGRRLRPREAEKRRHLQLPPAVPGADPYRDAGAGRLGGRRIALAIDEEDQAQSANEEEARRGRAHACILTFDVTDLGAIKPLAQFQVSETRLAVQPHARRAFRCASVLRAHVRHDLLYAIWFGGGLRIIDVADPLSAARGRPLHSGAGGRQAGAAEQRRGARRQRAGLHRRPPRRLRRAGVQGIGGCRLSFAGAFPLNSK